MSTVNERLKSLRISLGMNQKDFGERIEVAQTYLSQIEKGDRPVTDKISKIVCLQNWNGKSVNEEWFLTGNGEMFVPETKDEQITRLLSDVLKKENSDFKRRLVTALSKLDDTGWKYLEDFIDSISENK
ncbi:helix-turn-helix domain-containing protein [Bacteroides congonensis]|uniref:helix-turn-helix domain-containing protein n=1 Tax=Bacteroides congonensis TaxID=1871006 RepID=UPI002FDA75BE